MVDVSIDVDVTVYRYPSLRTVVAIVDVGTGDPSVLRLTA